MTIPAYKTADYSFESVVPHTGAMVLLDQIDYWNEQELQASLIVRADAPFADARGIPAWVGIEFMAQTIGAFGGCRSRQQGQPVKIGFLVGSRRYICSHSYFPTGAHLQVQVREIIHADNGLCVWNVHYEAPLNTPLSAPVPISMFSNQMTQSDFYKERPYDPKRP